MAAINENLKFVDFALVTYDVIKIIDDVIIVKHVTKLFSLLIVWRSNTTSFMAFR